MNNNRLAKTWTLVIVVGTTKQQKRIRVSSQTTLSSWVSNNGKKFWKMSSYIHFAQRLDPETIVMPKKQINKTRHTVAKLFLYHRKKWIL